MLITVDLGLKTKHNKTLLFKGLWTMDHRLNTN